MINKSFITKGSIYLFSNILNALVPFLLLPILTRLLTPEDYGVIGMFAIFLVLVNTFVGLNIHGAINVQYFKVDAEKFSEYVTSCLFLLIKSGLIVFAVVFLIGNYFTDIIGLPYEWMLIAVVVSFFQFLVSVNLVIWVAGGQPIKYGSFQVSQTVLNAGLSIILIVVVGMSWSGRLIGQSLAIIMFGCISFLVLFKNGHIKKINNYWENARDALKFGIPLIPHTIGAFAISSFDRIIISDKLGLAAVGIYMVGMQIGQAMALVSDSFNKVYSPWLMKNLANENINKIQVIKYSYLSMLVILLMGCLWAVLAVFILPIIVGEAFNEASNVIIYMSLGFSLTGLYYIVTNYVFYAKKTSGLAGITFVCGGLNIGLTYILVANFGIEGAALSYLIVQFIFFLMTWRLAMKCYPMPWFYFLKIKNNA